jgi:hypothetical protein
MRCGWFTVKKEPARSSLDYFLKIFGVIPAILPSLRCSSSGHNRVNIENTEDSCRAASEFRILHQYLNIKSAN